MLISNGVKNMLKKIAYDDKTGKEITGLRYKVYFEAVDIDDNTVNDAYADTANCKLLDIDMSHDTAVDMLGSIIDFIHGGTDESPERETETDPDVTDWIDQVFDEEVSDFNPCSCEQDPPVPVSGEQRRRDRFEDKYNSDKGIDEGKLIALYHAGWKQKDIAVEFGKSDSVISKRLKQLRDKGIID